MLAAALLAVLAAPAQEPAPQGYELRFRGNVAVAARELEKAAVDELADLARYGYRRAEVDDAAFAMESHYRAIGFPDARVRWRTATEGRVLKATFLIEEGPRTRLGQVRVRGAEAFSREQVRGFFIPPGSDALAGGPYFVESVLKGAASALKTAYWGQGYLDAAIAEPEAVFNADRSEAEVVVRIREGVQYKLRRVEFAGATQVEVARLDEAVAPLLGQPFFPRRAYEARTAVLAVYGNLGYPDAAATVEERRNTETGAVRLLLDVAEGPQVTIAGLEVRGNERTATAFVRSRMTLRKGDLYDQRRMHASFRALFETGLFSRIVLELAGEGAERILVVEVEEAKAKEVVVEPGYGSYEGLRLELGFRERNVFGSGRQFRGEVAASQVGWSALVGATDPWLLGKDLELDLPVYVRRRLEPSFTREEFGAALVLRKEWTREFSVATGLNLRRSNVSAVSVRPGAALRPDDVSIASLSLEPAWDTRNDVFNPTRGGLARLQVERGVDWLIGELEFLRGKLTVSKVIPLDEEEQTLLAGGWRSGVVVPTGGTQEIPLQERFFNGGEGSVRSFEEAELGPLDRLGNPIGGETFQTWNLELRRRLSGNLWGGVFADAGNVGLTTSDYFDDFRYGMGVGLRYLLPVGALRLDVGWNPDQRAGEDAVLVFLSVGMAF